MALRCCISVVIESINMDGKDLSDCIIPHIIPHKHNDTMRQTKKLMLYINRSLPKNIVMNVDIIAIIPMKDDSLIIAIIRLLLLLLVVEIIIDINT